MRPRSLRSRRRRRRSERVSPRAALLRAFAVLGLIALLVGLSVTAYDRVPGRTYRTAYAVVPTTGNLIKHDQVRVAGVRVGQVLASTIDRDGRARLRLQLSADTKLPADTTVLIRANGLLGARFVELRPGRSKTVLADGATIRGGKDALTYGVPEAVATFDRETRGALGTSVREVGAGLVGNGPRLNETIRRSAAIAEPLQSVFSGILARKGSAERLLPALDRLMEPLAESRASYARMLHPAAAALRPLVDERTAVRDALDAAPPALDGLRRGTTVGQRLLVAATDLSGAVRQTLPAAPGALRATTALLDESPRPLGRTASLLRRTSTTVPATVRLTDAASTVLAPLDRGLRSIEPTANTLGPYGCDLQRLGVTLRSMTGYGGSASVAEGPLGPPAGFRLQVFVPSPTELLQLQNREPVGRRDGYSAPCKYRSTTYTTLGPQDDR